MMDDGLPLLVLLLLLLGCGIALVWQQARVVQLRKAAQQCPDIDPMQEHLYEYALRKLELEHFKITNLFQQAFDSNPDACFILDPNGRFLFVNKAAIGLCNHLGKPVSFLLAGASLREINPEFLPDHFHQHFDIILHSKTPLVILYTEEPDGRQYQATYVPVRDGEVNYVMVSIRPWPNGTDSSATGRPSD